MQDMLKQLLADKMPALTGELTEKAGFDVSQAQTFVPAVMDRVGSLLKKDKIDVAGLASGALKADDLMGLIKPEKIASKVGIDASMATAGLTALLPKLLEIFKEKGGDLTSLLGGLAGNSGGLLGKVGKLFG